MSSSIGLHSTTASKPKGPKKKGQSGDLKAGDAFHQEAKPQPCSNGLLQDEGLDTVSRDSSSTTKTPVTEAEQKEQLTSEMKSFCSGFNGILENDFEKIVVDDQGEMLTIFQVVMIYGAIFLPNTLLIFGFSNVGYGIGVINMMAPNNMDTAGSGLLLMAVMVCAMFYCLDWGSWPKPLKIVTICVPGICVVGACLLKSRSYPFAPLVLILFLIPVLAGTLRITICKSTSRAKFHSCFFFNCMMAAGLLLFTWIYWMIEKDYLWNHASKLRLADLADELWKAYQVTEPATLATSEMDRNLNYSLDCGPDKNVMRFSSQAKTDIGLSCKKAMTVLFTCWTSPLIGALCSIFLGLVALFAGSFIPHAKQGDSAKRMEANLQKLLVLLMVALMGMYLSTSISGASLTLSNSLMAFFGAALGVCVVGFYIEIGTERFNAHMKESKVAMGLEKVSKHDIARAMFVGGLNVMLALFLVLNMGRQKARKCRKRADCDSSKAFTATGQILVDAMATWNWANVLNWICLLGELFFTFQVGVAKATYIFLSWLNNSALADVDYGVVIVTIFLIGYTMFLLPPVPGVPVYVFCGIVVAEQGRQLESVGFALGCIIACMLAWFLKLAACTGQYMIGLGAGKSIGIQNLIGVDKVPTRAIEKILSAPGLTLGKCAVLVGGPDWPTSVTCGILKLSIPQMLIGTAPVFFVSTPCVLAGAFLARVVVGEDSMWSAMASTSILVAGGGQLASGLLAMACTLKVIEKDYDELSKPRAEHEAVEEFSRGQAELKKVYDHVTRWDNMTCCRKMTIRTAAACQLMSGVIFAFGGEYSFRPFAISSKIDDFYEDYGLNNPNDDEGGNPINILLPCGYAGLGLFFVGTVLHIIFLKDAKRRAARKLNELGGPGNFELEQPQNQLIGKGLDTE